MLRPLLTIVWLLCGLGFVRAIILGCFALWQIVQTRKPHVSLLRALNFHNMLLSPELYHDDERTWLRAYFRQILLGLAWGSAAVVLGLALENL